MLLFSEIMLTKWRRFCTYRRSITTPNYDVFQINCCCKFICVQEPITPGYHNPPRPNSSEFESSSVVRAQGKVIIRGRRLFHILFTGSSALNILFYFSIIKKIIASKKLNMGFLSVPNLVLWLIFIVGSSASWQISFFRSDCSSKTHPPSLPLWVSIVGYL